MGQPEQGQGQQATGDRQPRAYESGPGEGRQAGGVGQGRKGGPVGLAPADRGECLAHRLAQGRGQPRWEMPVFLVGKVPSMPRSARGEHGNPPMALAKMSRSRP